MNLQEFYDKAYEIAKERITYSDFNISVISGCFRGNISHSINIFVSIGSKSIDAQLYKTPEDALEAIKMEIEKVHLLRKEVSEDIEIV